MNKQLLSLLRCAVVPIGALTALVYCAALQLSGGSAALFLWYLLLCASLLFLPGAWLCRMLLPQTFGTARVACSYVLGVAWLWISYAIAGTLSRAFPQFPLFAMFLPPAVLAILQLTFFVHRHAATRTNGLAHPTAQASALRPEGSLFHSFRVSLTTISPVACALALCVCAGILVYSFTGVLGFAHASAAGNLQYHQDMMWSVGNGAAVTYGFPLRDLRTAGGVLHYHYLADAVPGFLAYAGGILPYDAACYYNYPVLLFALVCAAHAAARAYGAAQKYAVALPFAVLFLQGFGSEVTLNVLRNMNGVIAASALACVVLYLLFWAEAQAFRPQHGVNLQFYVAFALCEGALLLSKNLYGILLFCAILAAVLVGGIVQRKLYKSALCMGLIGVGLFGALWSSLFRFAINNLVQEIWQSALTIPKTLALWLPLGFALYLISLVMSVRYLKRLSFGRLVVNAAVLGGLLSYFLFHHYSASQVYFLLAAILFLWFCTLDTLPMLFTRLKRQQQKTDFAQGIRRFFMGQPVVYLGRIAICILAAASLFGTLFTLLPVARTGAQIALRCLSLRPEYPYGNDTVSTGDEAAALWLREHMAPQDLFATNRNAKDMTVGEGTWHYYTAMSGRQAFVESWRYAMDYGMDYKTLRHNLEQVSDVIFAQEDAVAAYALAQKHGIRYLLVSIPLKPKPLVGAQPVYENAAVRIYEVPVG